MVWNAKNIQRNVMPVIVRQIVHIPPLYLNNYAQHNTRQFMCVTFNNHSKIFQGRPYSVTKKKILQFTVKD